MMSRTKKYSLILLGIASALGIAWIVRRRRGETVDMSAWRQVLIRWHGTEKAQQLTEAVRQQRAVLIAEASMPENQTLRSHLIENILPGLALYQVLLQEHDGDQSAALEEVDEAFRQETMPKLRWLFLPLKVLPAPLERRSLPPPSAKEMIGWPSFSHPAFASYDCIPLGVATPCAISNIVERRKDEKQKYLVRGLCCPRSRSIELQPGAISPPLNR